MRKNLLYRLTPFTNSNYLWNLQELFKRFHIFDGRKIIAIARGKGCDSIHNIERLLSLYMPTGTIEIIPVEIEDILWENTSFIPLLKKLREDYNSESITFYGHSKGVTRSLPNHVWKGMGHDICVNVWGATMYHYNLDQPYLSQIEDAFGVGYKTVGSFRRIGSWPHFHKDNTWHYSGGFWFVRTAELFKRDWQKILPTKFGPEGYIGSLFDLSESACIAFDNLKCEPYSPECLKSLGLLP